MRSKIMLFTHQVLSAPHLQFCQGDGVIGQERSITFFGVNTLESKESLKQGKREGEGDVVFLYSCFCVFFLLSFLCENMFFHTFSVLSHLVLMCFFIFSSHQKKNDEIRSRLSILSEALSMAQQLCPKRQRVEPQKQARSSKCDSHFKEFETKTSKLSPSVSLPKKG